MSSQYTSEANRVGQQANIYRQTFGHNAISSEHMLLAMLKMTDCDAFQCLHKLKAKPFKLGDQIRKHLETKITGTVVDEEHLYLESDEIIFELARNEAITDNTRHITTRHLLLGMLLSEKTEAARWLKDKGITPEDIRSLPVLYKENPDEGTGASNWDRISDEARVILRISQETAVQYNCQIISPEHILYAILDGSGTDAFKRLGALGIKFSSLQSTLQKHFERNSKSTGKTDDNIQLSDEFRQVLSQAVSAAQQEGSQVIDTTHLLIGILGNRENLSAQILEKAGVTAVKLRNQSQIIIERSQAAAQTAKSNNRLVDKLIFPILVIATLSAGVLLYTTPTFIIPSVFIFVTGGWLISLALHEFGHAVTAYWCGDKSVKDKGYLTLNFLKFTDPISSVIMPLLYLFVGSLGLPGGSVYIDFDKLSGRLSRSLTSFAGPLVTAVFGILLAIPFYTGLYAATQNTHPHFWAGMALLIYLQITSFFLTMLPLPGMDGFFIIELFLPNRSQSKFVPFKEYTYILLFIFVFWTDLPIVQFLWWLIDQTAVYINLPLLLMHEGLNLFRFWS